MKLFGCNEFAARLPSAVCCILLLALMFHILRRYSDSEVAWTALFVTASSACFFILSGATLVDAILALFSIGAVFLYYAFLKEQQRSAKKFWSAAVFVFLALAFITKGSVGLVYFGIPVFFWTLVGGEWNSLKNHAWILGGILFLLITIPVFLLTENAMPGFLNYFFVHENFLRFITKNYGDLYSSAKHQLPWGTAIPLTFVVCLPWALFPLARLLSKLRVSSDTEKRGDEDNPVDGNERSSIADGCESGKKPFARIVSEIRKYARKPEALFPIGLIMLSLFWSCSSHMMFYYLMVVVPLFGAWFGEYSRITGFPMRKTALATTVLMALYIALYFPAALILESDKSTRGVLREVAILSNISSDSPIVFVRRTPYSGYFYAGARLSPHMKESVDDSVRRGFENSDTVFIMQRKYFPRIPEKFRQLLAVRVEKGKWLAATIIRKKR